MALMPHNTLLRGTFIAATETMLGMQNTVSTIFQAWIVRNMDLQKFASAAAQSAEGELIGTGISPQDYYNDIIARYTHLYQMMEKDPSGFTLLDDYVCQLKQEVNPVTGVKPLSPFYLAGAEHAKNYYQKAYPVMTDIHLPPAILH